MESQGRRGFSGGLARVALLAWLGAGLAGCASAPEDAQAVLRTAEQAMGGQGLTSLRFAASGTGATFGQAWRPGEAWPRLNYSSFSRVFDYQAGAIREDFARSRAEPNGGGAVPLLGQGEQRSTGLARGDKAWNLIGPAPVPAPVAHLERIHDLWTSPHGVIKAAQRNQPEARRAGNGWTVSFSEPGRFKATAWIDADGTVSRVESMLPNHVMGDIRVVQEFSGYRDFQGVRFPSRIRQEQGGFPVLDLNVSEVQRNPAAGFEIPALVQSFAERVASEKAADGVWFLAGGSHNSVLIEMADHLILVESPLYDGRAQAVLDEARRLVPGKPIRWVINSHHHFDHSGGLRAAAASGATLVTSALAKPWFEQVLANPSSTVPDALARSGRKATVEGVVGRRTFTDGRRTVVVDSISDSVHAQGFQMIWLPGERLLIEADAYTPGAPNSPPPVPVNANNANLLANIERLNLNVDRILPLHGRMVALAELRAAVGRR